jgi:hypothetical protein
VIHIAKTSLVFLLVACIICCGLPRPRAATSRIPRGAQTSNEAAALPIADPAPPAPGAVTRAVATGEPVLAYGALSASAEPDTTDFEFPDDEKHLARDITVWVIASAFVAFFIIKVFLEEDTDEPDDDSPPGKQI